VLLQAFASLGLPFSMQNNDALRSALYGNQAIYNATPPQPGVSPEPSIEHDFSALSTTPITDTTDDKINDEISAISARLAALTDAINSALNNVQTNELPESLSQIDTTIRDLQAFADLQASNGLSPCSFHLSASSAFLSASVSSGTISVEEPSGCAWKASSGAPWLTLANGTSGSGNGSIGYSVTANFSSSPRDAIVIVGDQIFYVTQGGGTNLLPGFNYKLLRYQPNNPAPKR